MRLESVSQEQYGSEYETAVLEQWKTCVEMANCNTEKRNNSNNIYISINSAIFAVITYTLNYKSILLSIIGIFICVLWINSINSYKKLSSVKYHIINEIEAKLPLAPFAYEWEKLKNEQKYKKLTKTEKRLPGLFIALYSILFICQLYFYFH
ncbi:MAG: SLATT-5 domain-containing protein [Clostridium sp.]|jgi:hypothetical protein